MAKFKKGGCVKITNDERKIKTLMDLGYLQIVEEKQKEEAVGDSKRKASKTRKTGTASES